jgi:hypothetical protein
MGRVVTGVVNSTPTSIPFVERRYSRESLGSFAATPWDGLAAEKDMVCAGFGDHDVRPRHGTGPFGVCFDIAEGLF